MRPRAEDALKVSIVTRSSEQTEEVGDILGRTVMGGEVITLTGELGSGKTTFIRGLARGLEIPDTEVSSPTFIYLREHRGRLPLVHIDLYRTHSSEDLSGIGLEDYLSPAWIVAVEWADRAGPYFSGLNPLRIRILDHGEWDSDEAGGRTLELEYPPQFRDYINALRSRFAISEHTKH